MSTHNIGFYEDLTKIFFELSSNTSKMHLISSTEDVKQQQYKTSLEILGSMLGHVTYQSRLIGASYSDCTHIMG